MDPSAGIEAEYHHKNNRVIPCLKFWVAEVEILFYLGNEGKTEKEHSEDGNSLETAMDRVAMRS